MKSELIVSISGIRGIFGHGLDAGVLVRYAGAYGAWCRERDEAPLVIIGRDARTTGPICSAIVSSTLRSVGCRVIDAGLAATPTVEMAVLKEGATGGIIVSASHNPEEWNALKLLNGRGEFLSPEEADEVIRLAEDGTAPYVSFQDVGSYRECSYLDYHIDRILDLEYIDPAAISGSDFRVLVDGVNSVGGVAVPHLLRRLGVREEQIIRVNCEPTGRFAHGAEPLPENLAETCRRVEESGADLGLVVDPDADRLALIEEGGVYVSEELTQVMAADFLWRFRSGTFVTNLSSSRAAEDVAARFGASVERSAVGEINVVNRMREVDAILGGEGNGGVILPELHYGRDALAGTAIILQHLANQEMTLSALRQSLPAYKIVKLKKQIDGLDPERLLSRLAERYGGERINLIDGVKIDLDEGWVHLRKSNTEPIIRVYAEGATEEAATDLGNRFMKELLELA